MFMDHVVDPFEIPKHWERIAAADFGLRDPTVLLMGAIDPKDGVVYVYNEHYENGQAVPYHARKMNRMFDEVPRGLLRQPVGDPAGKKKNINDRRSLFDHYAEYGIHFKPGNNRIADGIQKVYSYLSLGKLKVFSTCANLIREGINYKYKSTELGSEKNLDENPIDKDNHACFIAGTLIETDKGLTPIESIKVGDMVMTRKGYRRVYDSAKTGINKEVYKVNLSNGSFVVSTGNHPFWVRNKGFLRVDSLRYSDIIEVSDTWRGLNWKESHTTEFPTGAIQTQKTCQMQDILNVQAQKRKVSKKRCTFIDKCGLTIMGKYLKDIASTTRITIHQTIESKILSWSTVKNIYPTIQVSEKRTLNTSDEYGHSQKGGTVQKKDRNGTENTQKKFSEVLNRLITNVCNALKNLNPKREQTLDFALINVSHPGEGNKDSITKSDNAQYVERSSQLTNTQKQEHVQEDVQVLSVTPLETSHDVYNISVEDAHEYFANGVLVSNCDSLRYMVQELPDDPEQLKNQSYASDWNTPKNQSHLPYALQEEDEYGRQTEWNHYY